MHKIVSQQRMEFW